MAKVMVQDAQFYAFITTNRTNINVQPITSAAEARALVYSTLPYTENV